MADLEIDVKQLESASRILSGVPGGFEKAFNSARSRALESGRAEAVRGAARTYEVKQAALRASISLNKVEGSFTSRGSPIPTMKFKVTPSEPIMRARVRARVKKSGGASFDRAFVARFRSGHVGVFERTGEKTRTGRSRLREFYSVSAAQMVGEENVIMKTKLKVAEVLAKRLNHEVERVLKRW